MLLRDIGVGVRMLCWCEGSDLDSSWHFERQDTKARHSFFGRNALTTPWHVVEGINLGLELQGKRLLQKGYTKRDEVKAFNRIFLAVTGEHSVTHPPIDSSKVRKIDLDHAFQGMPVAEAILIGKEQLDGKIGNFAILYEIAAIR